jgi:DnaJ-class molecular chaperone
MENNSQPTKDIYSKLQAETGIDFASLREKYAKNPRTTTDSTETVNATAGNYDEKEAKMTNERLDKYRICPACNGMGIIKKVYNHSVRESNCDVCDGDSIVFQEKALQIAAEYKS